MEKTTKKRKKSKRLKRRIGLIAVGGLSFVLTICLSVGATLAWFAGSTWASNDLYMGGPVYVEMAGRGQNGYDDDENGTTNEGGNYATWKGGHGTLDIAASSRSTGTAAGQNDGSILLPGQKLLIYSQARVYSTLQESTVADGANPSLSSGANNSNTSDGKYTYYAGSGRVQTTTTSVLRAKFSINIEFDPSVGFNNFTDPIYAEGYPVQSANYLGEYGTTGYGTANEDATSKDFTTTNVAIKNGGAEGTDVTAMVHTSTHKASLTWAGALGATAYSLTRTYIRPGSLEGGVASTHAGTSVVTAETGRRDAVANAALTAGTDYVENAKYNTSSVTPWVLGATKEDMWQVKNGVSKCIYQWKYVSKEAYEEADDSLKVGEPFNGMWNTAGSASANNSGTGNGYYALWVTKGSETTAGTNKANIEESEAFYKARTSNYLKSYQEHYTDDYGRNLVMQISDQLETLEDALNDSFVNLVNQSSDNIWAGNIMGFNADTAGNITYPSGATAVDPDAEGTAGIPASWLYVDPVIGNDTNSGDSASSVGGWWYLVENDRTKGNMTSGNNTIVTEIDNVVKLKSGATGANGASDYEASGATTADANGIVTYNWGTKASGSITSDTDKVPASAKNSPITGVNFQRIEDATKDADTGAISESGEFVANNDPQILTAKLYEITPNLQDKLIATAADGTTTTKVVSVAFPFVNGNFELPGQALTNVFANAKISFQITFQALQAFFPFSTSIDSIPSGTAITGTGKALNIGNAIPIYNEAFDYLSWL